PNASHCLCRTASAGSLDSTASRILTLRAARLPHRVPAFDSCAPVRSGRRPAHGAALGAGSELVVLVLEQDVERGERSVTAGNILLQVELVRIAQFVACVHLLHENSQIIPNHDDFVEECLQPATAGKLISTEARQGG